MSDSIVKMQGYVDRVKVSREIKVKYDIALSEVFDLVKLNSPVDAIVLAFNYGFSRGYKAGSKYGK